MRAIYLKCGLLCILTMDGKTLTLTVNGDTSSGNATHNVYVFQVAGLLANLRKGAVVIHAWEQQKPTRFRGAWVRVKGTLVRFDELNGSGPQGAHGEPSPRGPAGATGARGLQVLQVLQMPKARRGPRGLKEPSVQ